MEITKAMEENTDDSGFIKQDNTIPKETLEAYDGDELRARVFMEKYALHSPEGQLLEKTPEELWSRVSREISSVEVSDAKKSEWQKKFYWLLKDYRFIPGGRIMHGAGNKRKVTLLNCYVIPIKDDSIESIYHALYETARTYSYGGGVGVDIGVLRPKGARVNNAARSSTGAVSFMELFSLTTGTIGQSGRRGALMITIPDNHPDIMDFVEIKHGNTSRVRYANISVRLSDALMKAVEEDKDYALSFQNDKVSVKKTVRARELWNKLVQSARDSAEPGLIFWDNAKKYSTSEYNGMGITTTNPCSEIPLEPYGCCCLGNVNLAKFVINEFSDEATIDWPNLEQAMRYSTRFLDDVLDYGAPRHALKEQQKATIYSRRIGVGFTGLGDMLCKLKLKYDSNEAIEYVDNFFDKIKNIVYDESVNLAIEKGTFEGFDKEKHLKSPFIQELDPNVLARLKKHGVRNVALLTVPPVGSGAVLAGCTSGVEPVFANSYTRRSESLSQEFFKVYHPLVKEYMEMNGLKDEKQLPPFFVTAHQIKPEMRVRMQAAIQKHIDHAISSTVNLPNDVSVEEVSNIYFQAWKMGCKGITVYREGSREGVLITDEHSAKKEAPKQVVQVQAPRVEEGVIPEFAPMRRKLPDERKAFTHKFVVGGHEGYITVGMYEDGSVGELFIVMNKEGSSLSGFMDSFATAVSIALQYGVPLKALVSKFVHMRFEPSGVTNNPDIRFAKSIIDYVFKWLALKFLSPGEQEELGIQRVSNGDSGEAKHAKGGEAVTAVPVQKTEVGDKPAKVLSFPAVSYDAPLCANCGSLTVRKGACYTCLNCGTVNGCG